MTHFTNMINLDANEFESHLNNICKCTLKKKHVLSLLSIYNTVLFLVILSLPYNVTILLPTKVLSSVFNVTTEAIWFYWDPYNLYCRVKHGACDLLRQDLKVAPQSSRCSVAYFLLCLICRAGVLKVMANHSGIKRSWQLDWNTLALIACVSSWPNQPSLHDFHTKHAIGVPIMKRHMIL